MRVAITGASGLLGTAVSDRLRADGAEITRLVRSRDAASEPDATYWSPTDGAIDAGSLAGHHAVINLAGENIFGVWTRAKKDRIYQSRVDGTHLLATALAGLPEEDRPAVLINASAVGLYGSHPPDEPLTEEHPPADGFMATVVRDWEAATSPAADAGIRVVLPRFAPILDRHSLLLQATSLSTRLGLGATLGSGHQTFPWVTRDDVAGVVLLAIHRPDLHGPINVAAPGKVTNREFADTLARVLSRPRFLSIPAPLFRLLGDLGRELLVSAWVVPKRLEDAGYDWQDPYLEPALKRMLKST
jgi:uncharacterized protein